MENTKEILTVSQPNPLLIGQKKWYQHKGILIIFTLALLAGVSISIYFILNQPLDFGPILTNHKPNTTATSTFQDTTTTIPSVKPKFTYHLGPLPLSYDLQLLRIDPETNNSTVIVPSIKEAFPELKKQNNLTLNTLSFPANADKLFFEEILSDTDAGPSALVAYDLHQQKFTKLQISQYWQFDYSPQISPDGQRLLAAYDNNNDGGLRKLYSLNLETDTATLLTTLAQKETLDSCDGDCMGISTDLSWVDNSTAQYAVYDFTKQTTNASGGTDHPLIEKRKVTTTDTQFLKSN